MKRVILTVAVLLLAGPAQADLSWGDLEDKGCADPTNAPGLRQYVARLNGIPPGQSWEDTCDKAPISIAGQFFPHPVACINAMRFLGQSLCIEANTGQFCHKLASERNSRSLAAFWWPYGGATKPHKQALGGWVPDSARSTWKQTLNAIVVEKGVTQIKESNGGHSMWGVFLVADDRCLPPAWYRKAGPGGSWDEAVQDCRRRGQYLCKRDELCKNGKPRPGQPEGDVWAAVADQPAEWISVGTAYPDRLCRTHTEVAGGTPNWSQVGPQAVTGQPTAYRCCGCTTGCYNRP